MQPSVLGQRADQERFYFQRVLLALGFEVYAAACLVVILVAFAAEATRDGTMAFVTPLLVPGLVAGGVGWLVIGRGYVGSAIIVLRLVAIFLIVAYVALNFESENDCGRALYPDWAAIARCNDSLANHRKGGIGVGIGLAALSPALLAADIAIKRKSGSAGAKENRNASD